ncbi:nutritionally-regulated adipose and cardiac enriched protein homolog isoform X2 [Heptranchias perlo]|uniref:nutritionally-regulated adipose and cardiac enriched protein homolog isoform X2 n=1 Tax=Heptranchias perlo TaxID=212740 RepID=UPI0035594CED
MQKMRGKYSVSDGGRTQSPRTGFGEAAHGNLDAKESSLCQQEDLDRNMSRLSHRVQENKMSARHNADCTDDPIASDYMETLDFLVNDPEADSKDRFCKRKIKVQKDSGVGSEDFPSEKIDAVAVKGGEEYDDDTRTLPSHFQEGAGASERIEMLIPEEETGISGDYTFPKKSMLNNRREQLYAKGMQYLQQGKSEAALKSFRNCLQGLTEMDSFVSLPQCLHQIAEMYLEEDDYNRALQFVQAEKMYYEAALINLTAMKEESATDEGGSWNSSEKSSRQAHLARDYKKLTKLCSMSNKSHLALECSGEKLFVSENPASPRSFELLTSECKAINKAASLRPCNSAIPQDSAADQLLDFSNEVLSQRLENTPDARMHKTNMLPVKVCRTQEVIALKCPTSILRKRSNVARYEEKYVSHRTRSERRVRFRESDEIIFHTNRCNSHLPAIFRKLLIIILLSLVTMLLYCSESASNIYEQLQSKLISYYLEMKHTTFSWLAWRRRN